MNNNDLRTAMHELCNRIITHLNGEGPIAAEAERIRAALNAPALDTHPHCQCTFEAGDSPCPVHNANRWTLLEKTTPSGKRLFRCEHCGRESIAPDKVCPEGCGESTVTTSETLRPIRVTWDGPTRTLTVTDPVLPTEPRVGVWCESITWQCGCGVPWPDAQSTCPRCHYIHPPCKAKQ